MTWIHYIIIYCVVSAVLLVCLRLFNRKDKQRSNKFGVKEWMLLIFLAPFFIVTSPIWLTYFLITDFRDKRANKKREMEEERKENELKAKIGLRPDENYLCFSRMGGAGAIECMDCGYKEKITSFTHGAYSCTIGRQCPNCHAFVYEHNESEHYHTFGKSDEDFVCKHCGTVIRKKEEDILKGNDDPLFCPKCHSPRLRYHMHYIT